MSKLLVLLCLLLSVFALSYVFLGFGKSANFRPAVNSTYYSDIKSPQVCESADQFEVTFYVPQSFGSKQNNKFGLYIYAERPEFFELAQNLVNSNGGEWGYVLIPYNVKDYDSKKWSSVFNKLSSKRLIPIIQLHDVDTEKYESQTRKAANFLNSFVWPTKRKYISVYNEPNDAKFWYGRIAPEEYARILNYTISTFKEEDPDFFVMNGAFNISARTNSSNLDARDYMIRMDKEVSGIFKKIDGWASHSYPQPNFSGNPSDTGRDSIRAYEFELDFLNSQFGVKELPVFITETGWAHSEGKDFNNSFYSSAKIGDFFKQAYENVWLKDDRVIAVTPFTVLYDSPFDHFSWVSDKLVPYAHYQKVKDMKKIAGTPERATKSVVTNLYCF